MVIAAFDVIEGNGRSCVFDSPRRDRVDANRAPACLRSEFWYWHRTYRREVEKIASGELNEVERLVSWSGASLAAYEASRPRQILGTRLYLEEPDE